MNGSSALGRVIPSWLSDHTGVFGNYVAVCTLSGVMIIAMLGTTSVASVITFSMLYGFVSGAGEWRPHLLYSNDSSRTVDTLMIPLVAKLTEYPAQMGYV